MQNKSIWHTTKEKPMLHRDIILCGDGWSMAIDIIPETVNNICWKNVEKWCYLDDLLALETENKDLSDKIGKLETELERTRKALDVAVDELKEIDKLLSSNKFDVKEVPLLNITQTKISMLLKYINIEQKESAFVHNKIEFPEFNDNLLEEFDKQFFENGQDDDLTETALEQKD